MLQKEILGSYDFTDNINIYVGKHQDDEEIKLTHIHEESHRKIVSSTTFGVFQFVIANIQKQSVLRKNTLITNPQEILEITIDKSWLAHEGYAVFREITLGQKVASIDNRITQLPQDYKAAFNKYKKIEEILPIEIKPFNISIIRGIAEAAFNTSILASCPIERINSDLVSNHLSVPENQPDYRLELITKRISQQGFSREYFNNLLDSFNDITQRLGYKEIINIQEFMDTVGLIGIDENAGFISAWDEIETNLTTQEINRIASELNIIHPKVAENDYFNFTEEASNAFSVYRINIPVLRKADSMSELLVETDTTNYIPPENYNEQIIPCDALKPIIPQLLTDEKLVLIIEIAKMRSTYMKLISSDEFIYTAYLTLLLQEKIENKTTGKKRQKALVPTKDQLAVFGNQKEIQDLIFTLKDKLIFFVLDWTSLIQDNWKLSKEIEELLNVLEWKPATIVQITNSPEIASLLKSWTKIGIADIVLIKRGKQHYHFLLELKNGLNVIVKISLVLILNLNIAAPEFKKYLDDVMLDFEKEAKKNKIEGNPFHILNAFTVAELDSIGTFYHRYKN